MCRQSDSFTQIYKTHSSFLDNFLTKRGLALCDREDIIQDAFLRCYHVLETLSEGQCRSYLLVVARNLHIDLYRQRKKFDSTEPSDLLETIAADSEAIQKLQRRTIVDKLMRELLGQKESRFFSMHYYEGLKIREIAALTKTAEGTVAASIYRYRGKFEQEIGRRLSAAVEH